MRSERRPALQTDGDDRRRGERTSRPGEDGVPVGVGHGLRPHRNGGGRRVVAAGGHRLHLTGRQHREIRPSDASEHELVLQLLSGCAAAVHRPRRRTPGRSGAGRWSRSAGWPGRPTRSVRRCRSGAVQAGVHRDDRPAGVYGVAAQEGGHRPSAVVVAQDLELAVRAPPMRHCRWCRTCDLQVVRRRGIIMLQRSRRGSRTTVPRTGLIVLRHDRVCAAHPPSSPANTPSCPPTEPEEPSGRTARASLQPFQFVVPTIFSGCGPYGCARADSI